MHVSTGSKGYQILFKIYAVCKKTERSCQLRHFLN